MASRGIAMHENLAAFLKKALFCAVLLSFVLPLTAADPPNGAPSDPLASAVSEADIDVAACMVSADGKAVKLDDEMMFNALGLRDTRAHYHNWCAGSIDYHDLQGHKYHYRIAFKKPVAVGSLLYTTQTAAVLRDDAQYPGDPEKPEQWIVLKAPPYQTRTKLITFDPGFKARAFLFSDSLKSGRSFLSPVRLFARRLRNITPLASAAASREYNAPESFGGKLFAAADVVKARGPWISGGKNAEGNVTTPPISDIDPAWLALSWPEQIGVAGIWMEDNFTKIRLDTYRGPDNISPLLATEKEWKALDGGKVRSVLRNGRWLYLQEPLKVRGLRFYTDKVTDPRGKDLQAEISALIVFSDLGDAPTPTVAEGPAEPPYKFTVEVPGDGLLTVALNDADGIRVRNLIARQEVNAGKLELAWDLRNDAGKYVPPGSYRWQAIWHPGLRLRYEFSVYPNVSQLHPENTAWLNGMSGPGGWLADHSPPYGACSAGDRVYVGAPCPEAGVGFAACELSGRKLWGIHSFGPFSGARRMAADGDRVFVENLGIAYDDVGIEHVWVVDSKKQDFKDFIKRRSDEKRKVGVVGMAAGGNRLYLAIRGEDRWLVNATGDAAVDITRCLPSYKEPRPPKRPYEIVPNPRDDFIRLFRLKGDPPGYAENHGLTYLESTAGPQRRQHIMLSFKNPVNIGSCVFPVPQKDSPYKVRLSALKPDAEYPPKPNRRGDWIDFEKQAELPWDIAVAPPNCSTRALLITFTKGEEDELSDILDEPDKEEPKDDGKEVSMEQGEGEGTGLIGGEKAWTGRIEGLKILRRRYENLYKTAKVSVSSGKVDDTGVWIAERKEPLSAEKPEYFMMEWKEPQQIRGLAIKEIDCKLAEVDVWNGGEGKPVDMRNDDGWEKVGSYTPRRRMNHPGFGGHNALARYMDDTVDFGREIKTRAVRIRVMEQWLSETREGSCAKDVLGIDPARCRLFGVAPVKYIGGEAPFDPLVTERLEVWKTDGPAPALEKELPLPQGGEIALAPDGTLYAVSGKIIGKYDFASSSVQPLVKDVVKPLSMAADADCNLYVFDAAPERRNIRVYGKDGALLRCIGEEGGYQPGPWNQNRLNSVTGLAVDREGKVWAADSTYWPKRVSVWTREGKFLREYLGPTEYGGGGMLDPWDRSRLFYGPLEFALDWKTGTSSLKSLTWPSDDGWAAGDHPIHVNDRIYLATRIQPAGNTMQVAIVYLYDKQRLRQVAAMGYADKWKPLHEPAIRARLGSRTLPSLQFMWHDANEDGKIQFEEIVFEDRVIPQFTRFNNDLSVQAGLWRYSVKSFLPGGVPVYEKKLTKLPTPLPGNSGGYYRLASGNYYSMGLEPGSLETWTSPEGKLLYSYPSLGASVGPNRTAPPYAPAQVVCEFGVIGDETGTKGDLGECFVLHNNLGQWNVWTADGLLASRIFRDNRDPKRIFWQMPQHERGMNLDDLSQLEETFNGCFVRMRDDGRCYVVAGKAEASIVEVQGMDEFKRSSGKAEVTQADLNKSEEWEREDAKRRIKESVRVADIYRCNLPIKIDGKLDEWVGMPSYPVGDGGSCFRIAFDDKNLFLAVVGWGIGPFKNTGNRWDLYFKSGAAVDLQISSDENADPARQAPAAGDRRILLTIAGGAPQAVLYDMIVPGTAEDKRWKVASPVGQTVVDVVRKAEGVELASADIFSDPGRQEGYRGYGFEAKIPLAELGLKPRDSLRLKMDVGILQADNDGGATVRRIYWANPLAQTVADIPSEARVQPDMWGWIRFRDSTKGPALSTPGDLGKDSKSTDSNLELEE